MKKLYEIRRLDYAGRRTTHKVLGGSGRWEIQGPQRDGASKSVSGADLAAVISAAPELHRLTRGAVWITCDSGMDVHDLLGLLRVVDRGHEPTVPERWLDEDGEVMPDLCSFAEADEELQLADWEGLELVPRWIQINGSRAVLARDERRAAPLILDDDLDPVVSRLAFRWGFYGESGGPCSWDGGSTAGWCGPALWVRHRWGDQDPGRLVEWAPAERSLTAFLCNAVEQDGWEMPFIRAVVDMPGLTPEQLDAIDGRSHIDGEWLASHLPLEADARVLRELCKRQPGLREAVAALARPKSLRGKLAYAWLREVAQVGSGVGWQEVDAALSGGAEMPPPPDDDVEESGQGHAEPAAPPASFVACPRRGTHVTLQECWMCAGDVLAGRISRDEALRSS